MTTVTEQTEKLRLELRRGVLVMAVLSQLDHSQYGYGLIQALADKGMEIEEGTLYPLLRRLEKQGLLESEWEVGESRPRRYYKISPVGHEVLTTLTTDWQDTVNIMEHLLQLNGGKNE